MHSVQRNSEEFPGTVRHIVGRIGRRIVFLVRINPENGKVPGMARPYPVVSVASEFSDG